jgi:hypothetical protein
MIRCPLDHLQIEFVHGADDLDDYHAAVLRLEPTGAAQGGAQAPLLVLLHRYGREPGDILTLFLPSALRSDDEIRAAVARVLAALGLDRGAVRWQRSEASDASRQAAGLMPAAHGFVYSGTFIFFI